MDIVVLEFLDTLVIAEQEHQGIAGILELVILVIAVELDLMGYPATLDIAV